MTPGRIVAALLLPPLAIFLAEGVTRNFWFAFALTCLGYLPGIAFALFVLLTRRTSTMTATTAR
jgi:uncharacterized membrane protein YqaE (UPF0057 family)